MTFEGALYLFFLIGVPVIGVAYLVFLVGFLMKQRWCS